MALPAENSELILKEGRNKLKVFKEKMAGRGQKDPPFYGQVFLL